jgi:hypothetical protein
MAWMPGGMVGQRNQHFRTLDLVILVALCGMVSSIAGALLAQSFQDTRDSRALAGAEAWALQIKAQHMTALSSSGMTSSGGGRAPASVGSPPPFLTDGKIGRDPWGHPYHYVVRQGVAQNKDAIFVWSDGPDGVSQTKGEELSELALKSLHPFHGDDLGHVQFLTTTL